MTRRRPVPRRWRWAELLQRVFYLRRRGALVTGVLAAGLVAAFFFTRDEPW